MGAHTYIHTIKFSRDQQCAMMGGDMKTRVGGCEINQTYFTLKAELCTVFSTSHVNYSLK